MPLYTKEKYVNSSTITGYSYPHITSSAAGFKLNTVILAPGYFQNAANITSSLAGAQSYVKFAFRRDIRDVVRMKWSLRDMSPLSTGLECHLCDNAKPSVQKEALASLSARWGSFTS